MHFPLFMFAGTLCRHIKKIKIKLRIVLYVYGRSRIVLASINNALICTHLNKDIKMHEGAEMSEDLSLRSWIFSSKGTALMFCCYGNIQMESVYIIQSYNTQMCISLRNVHVSPFTHQSLWYHPHKDSPTHLGVEQGPFSRLQISCAM